MLLRPRTGVVLAQNGVVLGTCPPHEQDDGYRACSVAFYPSTKYQGPTNEGAGPPTTYHFLENIDCPAIFSDSPYPTPTSAGMRTGTVGVEEPVLTVHSTIADVSHAVYTWCKRAHSHPVSLSRRTSRRALAEHQVTDILTWQAIPHPQGDSRKRKRAHTPPLRSSRAITSTPTRSRITSLLPMPFARAPSLPTAPSAPSTPSLDIKTPPSASTAPAMSGATAWFVLQDGQVFDNAAEAEACMKLQGVSKIKIVPSLDDARAWYLARAREL
ncbi:hypothetical protein FB451DRAFT_1182597 [Mycena latifolia]|nr:hypothetical protein FB451DRAFT_1182597 [Mycena latifolia]